MTGSWVYLAVLGLTVVSGLPTHEDVLAKLDPGPRYQYVEGPDGIHLQDMWLKISDLKEVERYDPDRDNVYHLFTRANPSVSQPLVPGHTQALRESNYDSRRRTIVLIHGWRNVATSDFNALLVPAFLTAEDVNVFIADWSIGAAGDYVSSILNCIRSGLSVSNFITWLNQNSGSNLSQYHIVGHSLGGHQSGIVGRHLNGVVPYITALDPALPGWITNPNRFQRDDGLYTEVMHTNAGMQGFLSDLGDVDFYPNGGVNMPGCDSSSCNHHRCNFYMAESVKTGGFTGRRCASIQLALAGDCTLPETLQMGGINPKPGATGLYYVETNAAPPFSRG